MLCFARRTPTPSPLHERTPMHFSAVPAALAVCLLVAAAGDDEDVKKEFKKFEGTWVLASGERDGKKIAADDVKKSKIVMKGEESTLVTPHQSSETIKSKRKLDPSKKPAQVDFVRSVGPDNGETIKGIYEFIDADTYRVCFAPAGKERPTEFKTSAGSGHTLHVWKRSKE